MYKEGKEHSVSSDADSTRRSVDYPPYLQCIPDDLFGKERNTNGFFEAPKMISPGRVGLTKLVFYNLHRIVIGVFRF